MKKLFFLTILTLLTTLNPLSAFDLKGELKGDLEKYKNQLPGKGMLADKVEVDGITLENFNFMGGKKLLTCKPNAEVECQVDFKTDKNKISPTEGIHYLIAGFYHEGPQETVKRTLGFMSDSGTTKFSLQAPGEEGVYQIRFAHGTGLTFEQASEDWWENPPGANTTMGIVIVK